MSARYIFLRRSEGAYYFKDKQRPFCELQLCFWHHLRTWGAVYAIVPGAESRLVSTRAETLARLIPQEHRAEILAEMIRRAS